LVQSVAPVPAFLDDPFTFGQIAAAHALTRLHAMGAAPWTALAIASGADSADLAAMLQGATDVLSAEGCALAGVNRAEAAELSLGFAMTGLADAGKVVREAGLRPGDRLILTKPLGTGMILAAHGRGQARAAWLLAALAAMRGTNAAAARIMLAHSPSASVAVGGLGLTGHLEEMLRASGVAAVLRPAAIPVLPGAQALADHGIGPSAAGSLLVDPQISGGLLAGIPADRADPCLRRMLDSGLDAAIIGQVEPARADAGPIRLE
jgi:selenide,water dikinase